MIFCFDSQHAYILGEATQTLSFEDDDIHDNAKEDTAAKIHILNDLREDDRFCDESYVVGGINARFYAGVPITTAKGFNIGAFVSDNLEHR